MRGSCPLYGEWPRPGLSEDKSLLVPQSGQSDRELEPPSPAGLSPQPLCHLGGMANGVSPGWPALMEARVRVSRLFG